MNFLLSFRSIFVTISILAGTLTASMISTDSSPKASIYVVTENTSIAAGDEIELSIMVQSNVPANTFVGELIFDTNHFSVSKIDYNTSIANLWVEEPWYNRDKDSIYFAGGTSVAGGFIGEGELVHVTLKSKDSGQARFQLRNVRVLAHDGLGTDLEITKSLDTLISIDTTPYAIPLVDSEIKEVVIIQDIPPLDVNKDGKVNFQDIGVLLLGLGTKNSAYDFNRDGLVTWSDIRTWQQLKDQQ